MLKDKIMEGEIDGTLQLLLLHERHFCSKVEIHLPAGDLYRKRLGHIHYCYRGLVH